jgi:HTH-type transcriptional regulator, sugar sensing transcriptional regulator
MKNHKLFDQIRKLGFSEYETKCYLALFERESLAVSEVSSLAGIPRSNAYDALEKLLAKGLIVSIPGKMKKYAASDPWILKEKSLETLITSTETELENLERRRREILEMKIKEILDRKKAIQENIDGVVKELDLLYKGNRSNDSPLHYVEILKDPLQVQRKATQLCSCIEKEMLAFKKPPFYFTSKEQEQEQIDAQIAALDRGVTIRSIQEIPRDEADRIGFFEWLRIAVHPEKHKLRLIDELPIKMAVFDEKIAMYSMEDPVLGKSSITTILTENSALAKSFKLLFESLWVTARDYFVFEGHKYRIGSAIPIELSKKKRVTKSKK